MAEELLVRVVSGTDVGRKREHNEDSIGSFEPPDRDLLFRRGRLAIVADGMGGAAGGATASRLVVDNVCKTYYAADGDDPQKALRTAIERSNAAVFAHAEDNPELRGMGATCVALVLRGNRAYLAHVGDSRAYLIRDESILQVTEDHKKVARMVKDGYLTPAEATVHPERNVLLRVVGAKAEVEVDTQAPPIDLRVGDRFVLCSDGLYDLVKDSEILMTVLGTPLSLCPRALIDLANSRGGDDNISVVVVEVGGPLTRSAAATTATLTGAYGPTGGFKRLRNRHRPFRILIPAAAILLAGLITFGAYQWGAMEDEPAARVDPKQDALMAAPAVADSGVSPSKGSAELPAFDRLIRRIQSSAPKDCPVLMEQCADFETALGEAKVAVCKKTAFQCMGRDCIAVKGECIDSCRTGCTGGSCQRNLCQGYPNEFTCCVPSATEAGAQNATQPRSTVAPPRRGTNATRSSTVPAGRASQTTPSPDAKKKEVTPPAQGTPEPPPEAQASPTDPTSGPKAGAPEPPPAAPAPETPAAKASGPAATAGGNSPGETPTQTKKDKAP